MDEQREVVRRVQVQVKEEDPLTPAKLAEMGRAHDPGLSAVSEHDRARAQKLEAELSAQKKMTLNADLAGDLGPVEAKHMPPGLAKREERADRGLDVTELAEESPAALDTSSSPVSRHTSLRDRSRQSTSLGQANDAVESTTEGLKSGRVDSASTSNLYTISPELTPAQTEELSAAALTSSGEDFLQDEAAKMTALQKGMLLSTISGALYQLKSTAETTASAADVAVEVDAMSEETTQAAETVEQARQRLSTMGVSESQQDRVLDSLSTIGSAEGIKNSELTMEDMVGAAGTAAKKMAGATGRTVTKDEVLDRTAKAFEGRTKNEFSDNLMAALLDSPRAAKEKNPRLFEWILSMMSDEAKDGLKESLGGIP